MTYVLNLKKVFMKGIVLMTLYYESISSTLCRSQVLCHVELGCSDKLKALSVGPTRPRFGA